MPKPARPAAPPGSRLVALLRGINVGGHRVTMDRLRDHFASLGLADVTTLLASGNVLFRAPSDPPDPSALEPLIESHLLTHLGYAVPTLLRTPSELLSASSHRPFPAADLDHPSHTLHVGFLRKPVDDATRDAVYALHTPTDSFSLVGRELYWLCRIRVSDSPIPWPLVFKTLGVACTMRNITTVRKLAQKAADP